MRPLIPGHRVGRYQVVRLLGQGGMASVYLAVDASGAAAALKVLAPEVAGGELAARFEREVAAAARLSHPGCVRLLDHGVSSRGEPYLATELLPGPTLRAAAGRGRAPVAEAASIGRQLCDALAHAHDRGVVHRDVKPENVMFRRRGEVVLIDFGLSRLRDGAALTAAGTCFGSPSYLAPERLLDEPSDHRADIYAVGVVLYELLAGRPPFVGDRPADIALQHLMDLPRALPALRPDTPPELAAVIHRALEKAPADRFAHIATMSAALADTSCSSVTEPLPALLPS